MAVLLAERYKLPLWDICMAHLEYLFSDSGYVFQRRRRGDKYYLPLFDISVAHLEYLFSDSGYVFLCRRRADRYQLSLFDISVAPLEYLFFNILQSPCEMRADKKFQVP